MEERDPMAIIEPSVAPMNIFDGVPATPAARVKYLVDVLNGAFRRDGAAERFGRAGVIVRIDISDTPGSGLTLLLDRTPAEAHAEPLDGLPDIRLTLSSDDLVSIASEGSFLPMQIVSGEIAYEGPVRKFLRVVPIIRRGIRDVASDRTNGYDERDVREAS